MAVTFSLGPFSHWYTYWKMDHL